RERHDEPHRPVGIGGGRMSAGEQRAQQRDSQEGLFQGRPLWLYASLVGVSDRGLERRVSAPNPARRRPGGRRSSAETCPAPRSRGGLGEPSGRKRICPTIPAEPTIQAYLL